MGHQSSTPRAVLPVQAERRDWRYDGLDIGRAQVEAGIHRVGDDILHALALLHVGQVNEALYFWQFAKTYLGAHQSERTSHTRCWGEEMAIL